MTGSENQGITFGNGPSHKGRWVRSLLTVIVLLLLYFVYRIVSNQWLTQQLNTTEAHPDEDFIFNIKDLKAIIHANLKQRKMVEQESDGASGSSISQDHFSPSIQIQEYFNVQDGLHISWYHATNSQSKLHQATQKHYNMLEADIQLHWYGLSHQTNEPIMAHPPDVDSDLSLEQFVHKVISLENKGMKLDFKSIEVVEPSLRLLQQKRNEIKCPVFLNADIVQIDNPPVHAHRFLSLVEKYFPDTTLSLGWTISRQRPYTAESIHEMWSICRNTSQPITFAVCLPLLPPVWKHFKWLLNQAPERFSLTLWTVADPMAWKATTIYQLLSIRNDVPLHTLYYDLETGGKDQLEEFKSLCVTAGSPLHHFPQTRWDGLRLSWARQVNSNVHLQQALTAGAMMIQGDVVLDAQGVPVMKATLDESETLTLADWLDKVLSTTSGISMNIQSEEAVQPALNLLKERQGHFQQPVQVGGEFHLDEVWQQNFQRNISKYFPYTTVVVKLTGANPTFSQANVENLIRYVIGFEQPVWLHLSTPLARAIWPQVAAQMDRSLGAALSIVICQPEGDTSTNNWKDLIYIRKHSERHKVFYDISKEERNRLLEST